MVSTSTKHQPPAAVLDGDSRRALQTLLESLRISQDEAGRLFGVSGETVRRWARGTSAIPLPTGGTMLLYEAALDRLLALFEPARLPSVIRRPADLLDGQPALDWILSGRISDVASRYERVLRYQA